MLECKNCLLTDTYPFITFNEKGVCNQCSNIKRSTYAGVEALDEYLNKVKKECRNTEYDCLIGLSGGRDSSYMALRAVQDWNLRPFGYCYNNGHMPEAIRDNVSKISEKLDFNVLMIDDDVEKNRELFKKIFQAWVNRPNLGMVQTFCIGCRGGINKSIPKLFKNNNIKYVLDGANNYENTSYKLGLFGINDNDFDAFTGGYKTIHLKLAFALFKEFVLNPNYITPSICSSGISDFLNGFGADIDKIRPFQYEKYDPLKIIEIITNKLDWQKENYFPDAWRSDCDLALIKNYIFLKKSGFSDYTTYYSNMIRDDAIDRSTALLTLKQINITLDNSEDKIKELLENYNINYKSRQLFFDFLNNNP